MSKKEATIIQDFNAVKRQYEYSVKDYDVTKSIEILLKKHKEEYDKERRVFESMKGYLEAQQEYEKHIANLQSQLDQANERLKGAIVPKFKIGQEVWAISALRLNNIDSFIITEICYCADYGLYYKTDLGINLYEYYFDIFATLEEAQAKLQELRGGK